MPHQWVDDFFAAADSLDVERFCAALPPDIVWRFANFPTANGIMEVRAQYEIGRASCRERVYACV